MLNQLNSILFPKDEIKEAINKRNTTVIFYAAFVSIISRLLSIHSFLKEPTTNPASKLWQQRIIQLHFTNLIMWTFVIIVLLYKKHISKKTNNLKWLEIISYFSMVSLGTGASLIDQYITSDITPFMIGAIAAPVLVLINPIISTVGLFINYIVFHNLLPLVQTNSELILSNRTNALVVTFFSSVLSIMLYNFFIKNEEQERFIEDQRKALEYLAHTDPLTNLLNRRRFIELTKKEKMQGVIAAIDIDNFKLVNDKYGHPVGDDVLQAFSKELTHHFNENSLLARFGGEEFLILMYETDEKEAFEKLEEFRTYIEKKIFTFDNHKISFTISTGYTCKNEDEDSFYIAYKLADKALYKAKENGKNMVIKG